MFGRNESAIELRDLKSNWGIAVQSSNQPKKKKKKKKKMESSNSTGTGIETSRIAEKQYREEVASSTERTLALLHQLEHTVSYYNANSELPFLQRMNKLVLEIDYMSKIADKCNFHDEIPVPLEIIKMIDEGKNPNLYVRDMLNSLVAKNQATNGQIDAYKDLRKHMLEDLEQAFPDEVKSYREIRAASAAESKQLAQAQSMLANGDGKGKPEA